MSRRQCPVSDVVMSTGAGLEGSILTMRHCLLVLFSAPVLFLWCGALGFDAGERQENEPARDVITALVYLCCWEGSE